MESPAENDGAVIFNLYCGNSFRTSALSLIAASAGWLYWLLRLLLSRLLLSRLLLGLILIKDIVTSRLLLSLTCCRLRLRSGGRRQLLLGRRLLNCGLARRRCLSPAFGHNRQHYA